MTLSMTLLLAAGVIAGVAAPAAASAAGDPKLRSELQELSRRKVFFGHQSVGTNVVDGLERLAKAEGQTLSVVAVPDGARIGPRTFAHARVPENGKPLQKLESFERELAEHGPVDLALVKFCYVDIDATTDVNALYSAYEATIARLEAKYPSTTFVRVTTPLTRVQVGAKALVKRLIGRNTTGVVENARRGEFNELVRRAAARDRAPLFDLARVEATRPDGSVETHEWSGRPVAALVPAYTDDGGHLNDEGKRRAARELVAVLAAAPLRGETAAAERR